MDLLRKAKPAPRHDWTNTGSFINRPAHGWLHADEQLAPDAGICYGLRVRSIIPFDCTFYRYKMRQMCGFAFARIRVRKLPVMQSLRNYLRNYA